LRRVPGRFFSCAKARSPLPALRLVQPGVDLGADRPCGKLATGGSAAVQHVAKPVDSAELLLAVASLTGRRPAP